jgi:drug/metabolite transporter (DMT)-like permease
MSPAPTNARLLAHLAMLLFAALIAGSFTTGALAVPHLAPLPLNAMRFVLATLVMGIAPSACSARRFVWPGRRGASGPRRLHGDLLRHHVHGARPSRCPSRPARSTRWCR